MASKKQTPTKIKQEPAVSKKNNNPKNNTAAKKQQKEEPKKCKMSLFYFLIKIRLIPNITYNMLLT
jgi:anaerobic C4-dicarboxylate transporter